MDVTQKEHPVISQKVYDNQSWTLGLKLINKFMHTKSAWPSPWQIVVEQSMPGCIQQFLSDLYTQLSQYTSLSILWFPDFADCFSYCKYPEKIAFTQKDKPRDQKIV